MPFPNKLINFLFLKQANKCPSWIVLPLSSKLESIAIMGSVYIFAFKFTPQPAEIWSPYIPISIIFQKYT